MKAKTKANIKISDERIPLLDGIYINRLKVEDKKFAEAGQYRPKQNEWM